MIRKFSLVMLVLAASMAASIADAATLYITEITSAPPTSVYYQAAKMPAVASQTVAISGSSAQSAAFSTTTGLIRIHTDAICNVVIGGTNPTATTSAMRLIAGQTEYFVVTAGDKLAVIAGS